MASSKKNKTQQDKALAAKRVQFVKSKPDLDPAEARKRFFVQTRAAELQAKGVEVTKEKRQQLRQKFTTGGVQRMGFYTPGDLQRIAAAKAGAGSSGAGSTSGSSGSSINIPSGTPSQRPQDLADYKNTVYSNLDKENTARRPVAPKATSNKDFDKNSLNPMEFFKSPLAKGVAGFAKGAYKAVEGSAESFNATFINPTVNLVGGAIGKNPNLRQAGKMEAAVNTLGIVADIATVGASRAYTSTALTASKTKLFQVDPSVRLGPTVVKIPSSKPGAISTAANKIKSKISTAGKSQVQGTDDYASTALSNLGKGGKSGTVDLMTGKYQPLKNAKGQAIGPKSKSFPKGLDETPSFLKTPKAPKPSGSKVTGVDEYVADAVQRVGKGQKAGSVDLATGKYNPPSYSKMKDIDIDLKFGNAAEKSNAKNAAAALKPKSAAKPKATPKAKASAPKPAAAKKTNPFQDAYDDSPIDMSNVDFGSLEMRSVQPYGTARRATVKKADEVIPASVKKTPAKKTPAKKQAPKTTAPKANAKAAFDKTVTPFKTGSQTKLTFKTQADYNKFLKTGGKERLRQMSPDVRSAFERVNKKWMEGATEARQAAEAAQKNTAARAIARKGRYDRARPELKARFNQALIKKQERELLAKVTKKK